MAGSSLTLEAIKASYERVARLPTISAGGIFAADAFGFSRVYAVTAQKDTVRMGVKKGLRQFLWTGTQALSFPLPADLEGVTNMAFTANGTKLALARATTKDGRPADTFIEIWESGSFVKSIKATGKHGTVYDPENTFAGMSWAADTRRLLYAAEKHEPEAIGFFDPAKPDITAGLKYVRRDTWGEALASVVTPTIVVLDTEAEEFKFPLSGNTENVSWGQPVWAPGGNEIVCVGFSYDARRLGLKFCLNRPSSLYSATLDGVTTRLNDVAYAARSPVFSPSGNTLVWLENVIGGPHAASSRLVKYAWSQRPSDVKPDVIAGVVADDATVGVCTLRLPSTCFVHESALVFTTYFRSTRVPVHVDITTNTLSPLAHTGFDSKTGACDVLAASPNGILATISNPVTPAALFIGKLEGLAVSWTGLTSHTPLPGLSYQLLRFDGPPEWEAIVVAKDSPAPASRPLLAVPHGGPHSAFAQDFLASHAALAELGFVVLLINYRGSLAFGQASIDSLPGKVGVLDVADVDAAVSHVLDAKLADPARVGVYGGSHGGLLGAHMTGQHPQRYKAAVLRNPVIDIPSMAAITDIPDWCFVECGLAYDNAARVQPLSSTAFAAMQKASPVEHVAQVQAPTLLLLGGQDQRVPPSQGLQWHNMLRAKGVEARVLWFPDDGHALASLACDAESFIHIAQWFSTRI
eukprot:m.37631 g.37631  ORF g.37631 m.37631 type:complete len:693 (+) comp5455_c0_seq1:1276-3354(+)